MKVALLQTELIWENSDENISRINKHLDKLHSLPDLIVLPEMFNTGFTMNTGKNAQTMDGAAVSWMKEKSADLNTAICGSVIIHEEGENYNRFLWVDSGRIDAIYDKRHLFRMADEHHYFSAGKNSPVIHYKGWKIMPRVCYDLRFPVWSRSTDIDLQIYVANWPSPRVTAWDKLLMARAIENQCYVIGVNRIGSDGSKKDYLGHSIVIDPRGNPQTPEKKEDEGLIISDLDLDSLNDFRKKFPLALDADQFTIDL